MRLKRLPTGDLRRNKKRIVKYNYLFLKKIIRYTA